MKAVAIALALAASLVPASSSEITIDATSVNVVGAGTPVRVKLQRWSTDEERIPLVGALSATPRPVNPPSAATSDGAGARGARGGARGRGARGRGPAAPLTPIAAFTAALGRAPTLGYVWTNAITGYAIKYAWHATLPDKTERIVLASDRRLGAYTAAWKTVVQAPETDYSFTVIELRVTSDRSLEGKTSLTSTVVVDAEANTIALENYRAATPVLHAEAH